MSSGRTFWEFIWGTDKWRKGGDPLLTEQALNAARGAGLNLLEFVCRLAVAAIVFGFAVVLLSWAGAPVVFYDYIPLEEYDPVRQFSDPVAVLFLCSFFGAGIVAGLLRLVSSPVARIWLLSRDKEFRCFLRTEPPVGVPLGLLGRKWPLVVAAVAIAQAGAILLLSVVVMALVRSSNWVYLLPWFPFLVDGCIAAYLRSREEDVLGEALGYQGQTLPMTGDCHPLNEEAYRALIDRYTVWVRFYEENGLLDPSPLLFTEHQCDALRESYDMMVDRIEAWQQKVGQAVPCGSPAPAQ